MGNIIFENIEDKMQLLKGIGVLVSLLSVAVVDATATKGKPKDTLIYEHPGQTFNNGTPSGQIQNISGSRSLLSHHFSNFKKLICALAS